MGYAALEDGVGQFGRVGWDAGGCTSCWAGGRRVRFSLSGSGVAPLMVAYWSRPRSTVLVPSCIFQWRATDPGQGCL